MTLMKVLSLASIHSLKSEKISQHSKLKSLIIYDIKSKAEIVNQGKEIGNCQHLLVKAKLLCITNSKNVSYHKKYFLKVLLGDGELC